MRPALALNLLAPKSCQIPINTMRSSPASELDLYVVIDIGKGCENDSLRIDIMVSN